MDYVDSVLELIGHTPLVRLRHVVGDTATPVLAKVEYLNPGGSVKDRIASRMIDAAEEAGLLKPGGTIVEPTSGNTGVGLALVAQQRGYKCIFVCPDKVSEDKQDVLRAYGAEVVVCPTAVPPEDPNSYYNVSDRLAAEPGAWKPDQYSNPHNPRSHYETTGPEIWEQTRGRITHFVTGMGTGGTISGIGRYLKDQNPHVQVIGADPTGSVYSGGDGRPYLVEGVGEDFWPETYDRNVADRIIEVNDADSFAMTRELAQKEGLLVGGSAGLAVQAAIQVAHELNDPDAVVVVLLPDSGRGYLTKIFNDGWMAEHGFMPAGDHPTAAAMLAQLPQGQADFDYVLADQTLADAAQVCGASGASHLAVLLTDPPVKAAEIVGSISAATVLSLLGSATPATAAVREHMDPPLPRVGSNEAQTRVRSLVATHGAVVVHEAGLPVGMITQRDLLAQINN